MKKLYTFLSAVALTTAVNAQTNLIENGGFETWISDTQAENFDPSAPGATNSININLVKEATIKHGGNFAAKHQSVDGSAQWVEASEWIDVIAGHSYTISYWYLDNSPTAKTRIWSAWLGATGTAALPDHADVLRFDDEEGTSYSVDSPDWKQKTVTLTAPATAARFRLQVRTYRDAPGSAGGNIYYDDFSVVDNGVAGLGSEEIAGLKLFPNPLAAGASLNITSNNAVEKSVAIYDVLGKQVLAGTTNRGTVNTSDLKTGVYIVKITEGTKTATRKLIVQ